MHVSVQGRLEKSAVGLSPRLPCHPGSVHVEFVVDKLAAGQISRRVLLFFPLQYHSTNASYSSSSSNLLLTDGKTGEA